MIRSTARYRTMSCAALSALALAAVAGCAVSPESGGTLSREEFLKQGNTICAEGNAEVAAAVPESEVPGPPSGPEGEAFFQTIVTVSKKQMDGVEALKAPADLKPEVDSILSDARAILADIEAKGSEELFASEEDPFAAVNERLKAIGLTECAEEPAE
ncbi:MAG: hypothetical protein IPG72_00115 [Ardenticatenales bacterium]|nr:hypothetical protein [Ardenticatenales bacterium]